MQADCVDTPMLIGPGKSYIIREPLGVVAIIGSWNYPFVTTISPMANAIAAGNTVVLKPSELSPFSAKIIKTLMAMSIDSSCYQCVFGHVKVAIALTSSPVDKIIFTGSTEKGRLVAAAAAKNLVPCILELGGKSPMIVDKSANLEYAA
jgi:aldehyde dehydrogenase (NAD+)